MICYSADGLSMRLVADDYQPGAGEVICAQELSAAELASAFAGYADAAVLAARSEATLALSAACTAAIAAGFGSAVTGTTLTYTLSDTDQANLDTAYQLALMAETRVGAWAAGAEHALNDVLLADGVYYLCTTAGTTGTAAPAWPTAYQIEVIDGSAGWSRAGYLVGTSDGTIWVSASEATALWIASKGHIATCRAIYRTAKAAIAAAANADTVNAIVAAVKWP